MHIDCIAVYVTLRVLTYELTNHSGWAEMSSVRSVRIFINGSSCAFVCCLHFKYLSLFDDKTLIVKVFWSKIIRKWQTI